MEKNRWYGGKIQKQSNRKMINSLQSKVDVKWSFVRTLAW